MVWIKCSVGLTLNWWLVSKTLHKTCFAFWPEFHLKLTLEFNILTWSMLSMLMTLKCRLRNMLLKIASWGTSRIIMEFLRIFNVNLRLTWAKCYLTDRCKYSIQNWGANLLLTTNWLSAAIIFHGPNFLTTMQEINAALCIVSNELLHIFNLQVANVPHHGRSACTCIFSSRYRMKLGGV